MAPPPFGPLAGEHGRSLSKLLKTGAYSDLTITCGTDKYAVHKAIVCSRSSFFAAACDGELKEAKTGEIDLPEDDPVAVKMMIRYLYTQNYTPPLVPVAPEAEKASTQKPEPESDSVKRRCVGQASPSGFSSTSTINTSPSSTHNQSRGQGSTARRGGFGGFPAGPHNPSNAFSSAPATPAPKPPAPIRPPNLVLHAKVYALGERYGIKDLKDLALFKFTNEAVDHHHSKSFMHATRYVYGSTIKQDRGMRDAVVRTLSWHVDLFEDEAFQSIIKDTELGLDLLLDLTQIRRGDLKRQASSL
ncbi:amino acid transport gap1 [Fusarium sporotrichioides]|uniref:Amino acid transport gap1 n=1 Tax=Fusarium sporotrichioides TaxID=5514 RepID=A0A395SR39_FUSSP|nr:amino acid transport gap1 [Fusarium sporotrichioides]